MKALSLWVLLLSYAAGQTYNQPLPCTRWSGQVAMANSPTGGDQKSTLWYYGGSATTRVGQPSGWWTNALVSLDLTSDWNTGTPPLSLVEADTGNYTSPPAVALGALWPSSDGTQLLQYGGQFSDTPTVAPSRAGIWRYTIASGIWDEVPTTGDAFVRAAEGSSAYVPGAGTNGAGIGFYFSGHLDSYTVQGWSNQIPRVYLNSLFEFDVGGSVARNHSDFSGNGSTSNNSSPVTAPPVYRADGTLSFIPNTGTKNEGILVAIGGATSDAYIDNAVLDVYDIGADAWTKQGTMGEKVGSRVNHCAVVGRDEKNGVSQIIIYGGQKLNQESRDSEIYMLTIPTYTWTKLGTLPGSPTGRAGHQCALSGSQLVVMGGYLGGGTLCDQPGVYVFDTVKSVWSNTFKANTEFTTPDVVRNITDDGTQGDDTKSNSSVSIGAIVGGVIGGIVALGLLAFLLWFFVLRKRNAENDEELHDRKDSSSPNPPSMYGGYAWQHSNFASDDVEEDCRNMDAAFSSHLVPKAHLRVINADEVDRD